MNTITINELGHIQIPLELNRELNLMNNEQLIVSVKSDHIVIIPSCEEIDENLIEALIHDGIIIDVKMNK